jgi:hypothetical protein
MRDKERLAHVEARMAEIRDLGDSKSFEVWTKEFRRQLEEEMSELLKSIWLSAFPEDADRFFSVTVHTTSLLYREYKVELPGWVSAALRGVEL